MKEFLRMLLLTISVLMLSVSVFATDIYGTMLINEDFGYDPTIANGIIIEDSILVQLNGEVIDFTDENGEKVEPQIINDRTMVPMRKIFEVFGANVEWINDTRSIKATTEELEIGLQIDNTLATVTNKSGEVTEITLDAAPVIIDGRTLVPVRFIAESLDKKVGWDAYNRVVIIIDTSFVEEILKEDASNLYEYLTTDFEKIETYEMEVELSGKVKYQDKEERKNNTTLNLAGDMNIKLSETAMSLDLDLNFTGKGTLIEAVKDAEYEDIEMNLIIDLENNAMYIKMSTIEESDKWIKYDIAEVGTELKSILEMAKEQNSNGIESIIDAIIIEDSLTVSSYEELKTITGFITELMGNDKFKVSGRTTKTYKYTLELSDIIDMVEKLAGEEVEYDEDTLNFEIEFEVKVANNVTKESNCTLTIEAAEAEENVEITLETNGTLESYNEKVTIKMPKEKDIIEMYEE